MNKKKLLSIVTSSVLIAGIASNAVADVTWGSPDVIGIQEQMQGGRNMQRGGGMQPGGICSAEAECSRAEECSRAADKPETRIL